MTRLPTACSPGTRVIVGCGYLGRRVARRWVSQGQPVVALTRSSSRARELEAEGITPLVGDVADRASLKQLPACETLLYAVGYDAKSGRSRTEIQCDGLRNVLDAMLSRVEQLPEVPFKLIFISSTGVYSQNDGEWVDESSPCQPLGESGQAVEQAERIVKSHPLGSRSVILRMAGLYGPGRVPHRDALLAAKPIEVASDGFLNLVYIDDAAEAVLAAERSAPLPSLYLVSDGHPVLRHVYYQEAARLLNAPPPQLSAPPAGSQPGRRGNSSKRISNAKLVAELSLQFRYPTFREGLAAALTDAGD